MLFVFFFNDTATTEIYTLSLHDALPIYARLSLPPLHPRSPPPHCRASRIARSASGAHHRSEEHTSELQSRPHLVCRLLLEKKKTRHTINDVYLYNVTKLPSHYIPFCHII